MDYIFHPNISRLISSPKLVISQLTNDRYDHFQQDTLVPPNPQGGPWAVVEQSKASFSQTVENEGGIPWAFLIEGSIHGAGIFTYI